MIVFLNLNIIFLKHVDFQSCLENGIHVPTRSMLFLLMNQVQMKLAMNLTTKGPD